MYPYVEFLGMSLYELCLTIGVISALAVFRIIAEKRKASAEFQNFILINSLISVITGYCSAVLFQAFYNYMDTGVFEINRSTGATFLGGLIGGAGTFLLVYFIGGHFLFKSEKEHLIILPYLLSIAGPAIASAHAFGRLGCFFAGCCYGHETDSFLGIYMPSVEAKVLPVQLYECIFLFALAAVLIVLEFRKKDYFYGLPVYMVSYGLWRFFAEYLRADERGSTIVSFLSPSQLTAVLMFIGGIVLFIFLKKKYGKSK